MGPSPSYTIGAAIEIPLTPADARRAVPHIDSTSHLRVDPPPLGTDVLEIADGSGRRFGTIGFETESTAPDDRRPTRHRQNEFKLALCREISRLEQWSVDRRWPTIQWPELHVVVSDRYKISKSLVPAWYGRAGHMEFPAWRVITHKAAIAHELVHVVFPNANRFLAEGLAICLQAEIGGNPAFPNFGRPLHALAREVLQDMVPEVAPARPESLVHLGELDAIATPAPLTLWVGRNFFGEGPRGQGRIYPLAGSFVQFLVEAHGWQRFHALYEHTPLVPLKQNAGPADRWVRIYGKPFADLEHAWKSMIVSCNREYGNA